METMIDTEKIKRINRFTQILICICEHYWVNPNKIANWTDDKNWKNSKCPKVTSAKQLFIYHLHECGMSYEMIGKYMRLSVKTVEQHRAQGKRLVLDGMRDFVDELPKITSTLSITRMDS